MARHHTFVLLDDREKDIVESMRSILKPRRGQIRPAGDVIRAIIRDYWSILQDARDQPPPECDTCHIEE